MLAVGAGETRGTWLARSGSAQSSSPRGLAVLGGPPAFTHPSEERGRRYRLVPLVADASGVDGGGLPSEMTTVRLTVRTA